MRQRGLSSLAVVVGLLLLVLLAVAGYFLLRPAPPHPVPADDAPQPVPTAPAGTPGDAKLAFELTRAALAATENLDPEVAAQGWNDVLQVRPGDLDGLRNAALNRVLQVKQLAGQLFDSSISPKDKAMAKQQLPGAIRAARGAADAFEAQQGSPQLVAWMRAVVDSEEAGRLPGMLQQSARSETFLELAEQVKASDKPLIMLGPLTELATLLDDPIDGLPPEIATLYPQVLRSASDKHPRNLFLATEALVQLLSAKHPAAAELAQRVAELSEPLAGLLEKYAIAERSFVQQQTATIQQAVADGNWDAAEVPALQIRNVLTSTEIMRTDRRRASPNALDLLSFNGLRELAAAVAAESEIGVGAAPLQFAVPKLEQTIEATALATADVDLDGQVNVLTVHEGTLTLFRRSEDGWQAFGSTAIADDAAGVIVTDLFMVDASEPSRIRKPKAADLTVAESAAEAKQHETYPSAVVFGPAGVQVFRIDGRSETADDQRLLPPASPTGLEEVAGVLGVQPADFDADGDLDLAITTADQGLRLWVNRGNMTFFEVTQYSQLPPADDPVTAMNIGDIDRDLDLDILLTHGKSGRVAILENLLHLQFRWRVLDAVPPLSNPSLVAIEELDGDVSWDVVAAGNEGASLAFTNTIDAGQFDISQTTRIDQPASASVLVDLNNDSWLNWLAISADASTAHVCGPWGARPLPLNADLPNGTTQLLANDIDRDGTLDLVGIADGKLWTALNTTKGTGHYIDIRFRGKNDNNENSGRINHYGIGTVLELRFGPHYRSKIITDRTTHFGLDGFQSVDLMRAILPNGITQNAISPPVDTVFNEEQTLKGSCPYLYAWDGEKFAFVTDCLWAAPLGLQIASDRVAPDRPWEYLKVPGEFVAPRDGQYELRITEELWEAAYFDHLQLSAVDHPADVEIFTNEKVGPDFIATPTIFAFDPQSLRPVESALNTTGQDVTERLATDDQRFVKGFDYRIRQGLCPPHWIELDLGAVKPQDRVLLVLTGWILPTDTSLNIQIDQNPALSSVQPPSVLVPDGDDWRVALPFMGFPGGKTKTIVVDLTGHLNPDDSRVRIRTSAQIYWDRAAVAINPPEQPLTEQPLDLLSAELTWHGFSRRIDNGETRPETYEYADASSEPRWPPLRGTATAYGDVLPLLTEWDDRMIVMGSGDEIRLKFSLPEQPLPAGWKRDYILHCVGWDKDADLNTLTGQDLGPLPFRAMQAYPPSLQQADAAAEVWQKNASHLTRKQPFRSFWSRPRAVPSVD